MLAVMVLSAPRLVLVDHGGPLAVVAHARHEILDARTASSREGVTSVAQVVEVQDPPRRPTPPHESTPTSCRSCSAVSAHQSARRTPARPAPARPRRLRCAPPRPASAPPSGLGGPGRRTPGGTRMKSPNPRLIQARILMGSLHSASSFQPSTGPARRMDREPHPLPII